MTRIKSGLPFVLAALTMLISSATARIDILFVPLIVAHMITLCLYVPYFWFQQNSSRHGNWHFTLTLLALLHLPVLVFLIEEEGWEWINLVEISWFVFSALALISNIIAVPLYMLPALPRLRTDRDETLAPGDETVAIAGIEPTIKELRTQFDKFYQAVSQGRAGLQETFSRIQQEFESQTAAIARMKREVDEARKEAEHHRRISNLSKEDQRAFLDLIARNKRQDYWIGLGTGIVSSVFGAAVIWLLGELSS